MSTKRSKRHQLIVRASNHTRAIIKQEGKKFLDATLYFNGIEKTQKLRSKSILAEWQKEDARQKSQAVNYKDKKTVEIRWIVEQHLHVFKGLGTIK